MIISLSFFIALCFCVGNARIPNKIIEGYRADEDEFKFLVQLRYQDKYFCGGSIIDSGHILTAAHCMYDGEYNPIRMNKIHIITGTNFNKNNEISTVYESCKVYIHRDFDYARSMNMWNDIPVIKLKRRIEFDSAVQPINLPTKDISDNSSVQLAGWGGRNCSKLVSEYLLKLDLKIMNDDECKIFYGINNIVSEQFCTRHHLGYCSSYGDSGNPLVTDNSIVGLVSMGDPHNPNAPDVHTRVYSYVKWINEIRNCTSEKSICRQQMFRF